MSHEWLQNIHEKARCPQCGEYEFRRSRARNMLEEFRKEHSHKRPYRCHACNFRVWIDPVKLSFDYKRSDTALPAEENPLPVPTFDLGETVNPGVSDVEDQFPDTDLQIEDTAPVVSPDNNKSDSERKYPIEFDPDDIQAIRPHQPNVDFIPHDTRSRHGRRCPVCGRTSLFRSHSKNLIERIRKKITSRRAYRCHNCEWRGWLS